MKISDELRQWSDESDSGDGACDELRDLADRIDNEMVELPKDADGVPIRVGDTVWTTDGSKVFVIRICIMKNTMHVKCGFSTGRIVEFRSDELTHERPDTLERIADDLEDWSEDNRVNWSSDVFDRAAEFAHRVRKLAGKEGGHGDE